MSRTAKAERTRQHILETALRLFTEKGYEETTMRDIAAEADCSIGLAYRYFDKKESLVLELYAQMAEETARYIDSLPVQGLGQSFYDVMSKRLQGAQPFRHALGALFSTTLNPNSDAGLLGEQAYEMRKTAFDAFLRLVENAKDAPQQKHRRQIAIMLYSLHFGVILFWLHDKSTDQRSTYELLGFIRGLLGQLSMLIRLPYVGSSLAQLSEIIARVFIGEKIIERT